MNLPKKKADHFVSFFDKTLTKNKIKDIIFLKKAFKRRNIALKLKTVLLSLILLLLSASLLASCSSEENGERGNRIFILNQTDAENFKKIYNGLIDGSGRSTREDVKRALSELKTSEIINIGERACIVAYTYAETSDESIPSLSGGGITLSAEHLGERLELDTVMDITSAQTFARLSGDYSQLPAPEVIGGVTSYKVIPDITQNGVMIFTFISFEVKSEATLKADYTMKATTKEDRIGSEYESVGAKAVMAYGKRCELEEFKLSFLEGGKYTDGRYEENELKDLIDMTEGKEAYGVISFKLKAYFEKSENDTVTLVLKISPSSKINGTLDYASGGEVTQSETETEKLIYIKLKLPNSEEDTKEHKFIIKLIPFESGRVNISSELRADGISIIGNERQIRELIIDEDVMSDKGVEYTLSEDKSYYTVTGLGKTESNSILIHSEYNGIPVKAIASSAFRGLNWIRRIEVDEGVEIIESSAFENCSSLTVLTLPSTAKVEPSALSGCTSLKTLTLNMNGKTLSDLFGSSGCPMLKTLTLTGDTAVGERAFEIGTNIESIKLPVTLESVPKNAFEGLTVLQELSMPSSAVSKEYFTQCGVLYKREPLSVIAAVNKFSDDVIYPEGLKTVPVGDMKEVTNIVLPESAAGFSGTVKDLCPMYAVGPTFLFERMITSKENLVSAKVLAHPEKTWNSGYVYPPSFENCENLYSVELPEGEKDLPSFKNCKNLSSVIIPEGVSSIPERCFDNCTSLKSIKVPASVVNIGKYAFYGCEGLEILEFASFENWYYAFIKNGKGQLKDLSDSESNPSVFAAESLGGCYWYKNDSK